VQPLQEPLVQNGLSAVQQNPQPTPLPEQLMAAPLQLPTQKMSWRADARVARPKAAIVRTEFSGRRFWFYTQYCQIDEPVTGTQDAARREQDTRKQYRHTG